MNNKVIENQIRFHLDKIDILNRAKEMKKQAGEKKAWKAEEELNSELNSIQQQIDNHNKSVKELQSKLTT